MILREPSVMFFDLYLLIYCVLFALYEIRPIFDKLKFFFTYAAESTYIAHISKN
jgi:hypothetical protein